MATYSVAGPAALVGSTSAGATSAPVLIGAGTVIGGAIVTGTGVVQPIASGTTISVGTGSLASTGRTGPAAAGSSTLTGGAVTTASSAPSTGSTAVLPGSASLTAVTLIRLAHFAVASTIGSGALICAGVAAVPGQTVLVGAGSLVGTARDAPTSSGLSTFTCSSSLAASAVHITAHQATGTLSALGSLVTAGQDAPTMLGSSGSTGRGTVVVAGFAYSTARGVTDLIGGLAGAAQSAPVTGATAAVVGSGQLSATAELRPASFAGATLTGVGAATANGLNGAVGQANPTGSGQVVGTGRDATVNSAGISLNGTTTLSIFGYAHPRVEGASALVGSLFGMPIFFPTFDGVVLLVGSGQVDAGGNDAPLVVVVNTLLGTSQAEATATYITPLYGSSLLTGTTSGQASNIPPQAAAVNLLGSAVVGATPMVVPAFFGSTSLGGSAGVITAGLTATPGTAVLQAFGALTPVGLVGLTVRGSSAFAGALQSVVRVAASAVGGAALPCSGSLLAQAAATGIHQGVVALIGSGRLVAAGGAGRESISGATTLTGSILTTAQSVPVVYGAATFIGAGQLGAVGQIVGVTGTAALRGSAAVNAVGEHKPLVTSSFFQSRASNSLTSIKTDLMTLNNMATGILDGKSRLSTVTALTSNGEAKGGGLETVPARLPTNSHLMARPTLHASEGISASILTTANIMAKFTVTVTTDAQHADTRTVTMLQANLILVLTSQVNTEMFSRADTTCTTAHLVQDPDLHFRAPHSLVSTSLSSQGFSALLDGVYKPTSITATGLVAVAESTGGSQTGTSLPRANTNLLSIGEQVPAPGVAFGQSTPATSTVLVVFGETTGGGINFGFTNLLLATTGLRATFVVNNTHDASAPIAHLTVAMTALTTITTDVASVMTATCTTDAKGAGVIETALVQTGGMPTTTGLLVAGVADELADAASTPRTDTGLAAFGWTPGDGTLRANTGLLAFGHQLITEIYVVGDPGSSPTMLLAVGNQEGTSERTRRLGAFTGLHFLAEGIYTPPPSRGRSHLETSSGIGAVGTTALREFTVVLPDDDTLLFPPMFRRPT